MRRRRALITLATLPIAIGGLRAKRARAAGRGAPATLVSAPDGAYYLHADRDHLYYSGKHGLYRLGKRGGKPTKIFDQSLSTEVMAGGRFYYEDSPPEGTTLDDPVFSWKSVPVGGGKPTTVIANRRSSKCAAADASGFYFMEMNEDADFYLLFHLPPSPSGAPPREVAELPNEPGMMLLDRTHIFWSDMGGIKSVPKAGGVPEGLDSDENDGEPENIVLDDHHVYWTARDAAAAVYRVDKSGRHQVKLAKGYVPDAIALSSHFVYFGDLDEHDNFAVIRRVPKQGNAKPETIVARKERSIEAIVADDRTVIWLEKANRQVQSSESWIMSLSL